MKKHIRQILSLFVLAMIIICSAGTMTAFAATKEEVAEYSATAQQKSDAATILLNDGVVVEDGSGNMLTTATDVIKALTTDTNPNNDAARDAYIAALVKCGATKKTASSGGSNSDEAVSKIDQITNSLNISADIEKGSQWLGPEAQELISQIIGFITVVVLMAVGVFTALDVMFLEIPVFHTSFEEKAVAKGTTTKDGKPKPRMISTDAVNAYEEASETGKNVLLIYLKKRIVAYIAVAVVVYMLLSGNLNAIIRLVLKLISGGLDTVTSIGN